MRVSENIFIDPQNLKVLRKRKKSEFHVYLSSHRKIKIATRCLLLVIPKVGGVGSQPKRDQTECHQKDLILDTGPEAAAPATAVGADTVSILRDSRWF